MDTEQDNVVSRKGKVGYPCMSLDGAIQLARKENITCSTEES